MDTLQGSSSGTDTTNPQTINQTALTSQSNTLQGLQSSQPDLTTLPTNSLTVASCMQNCALGVSSSSPVKGNHALSSNALGISLLVIGVVVVGFFAGKVLTS